MLRRFLFAVPLVFIVSGCSTTSKNQQPLYTQLQLRVSEVERQVQEKDEQIASLKYDIKDLEYEIDRLKTTQRRPGATNSEPLSSARTPRGERIQKAAEDLKDDEEIIRVTASIKQVQAALKNAGYYKGTIDSKIGAQTKAAISQFQKDHGLNSDGIIGQKTWNELKLYLE